jgi:hypothetical protein
MLAEAAESDMDEQHGDSDLARIYGQRSIIYADGDRRPRSNKR